MCAGGGCCDAAYSVPTSFEAQVAATLGWVSAVESNIGTALITRCIAARFVSSGGGWDGGDRHDRGREGRRGAEGEKGGEGRRGAEMGWRGAEMGWRWGGEGRILLVVVWRAALHVAAAA